MPTYNFVLQKKNVTKDSFNTITEVTVTVNANNKDKAQEIIDENYKENEWSQLDSYDLGDSTEYYEDDDNYSE